jgi:hypothetical protein
MADTLVATLFPATTRVSVSLTWNSAPIPATATVERVDATGYVTAVRGAERATLVVGAWVGDDFEAPLDVAFYYRATSADRPGEQLTSATYSIASGGSTWLKHPGKPFLNSKVTVGAAPSLTRPVAQGVFDVLGRSAPVAVTMRRNSARGELSLVTATDNERYVLLSLIDDGSPLYLQTPAGFGIGNVYVAVGEVAENRIGGLGAVTDRLWSLPFTVIDRPIGPLIATGNSWNDLLGAYPTWSQALDTEGTWTGVLEGIG